MDNQKVLGDRAIKSSSASFEFPVWTFLRYDEEMIGFKKAPVRGCFFCACGLGMEALF